MTEEHYKNANSYDMKFLLQWNSTMIFIIKHINSVLNFINSNKLENPLNYSNTIKIKNVTSQLFSHGKSTKPNKFQILNMHITNIIYNTANWNGQNKLLTEREQITQSLTSRNKINYEATEVRDWYFIQLSTEDK